MRLSTILLGLTILLVAYNGQVNSQIFRRRRAIADTSELEESIQTLIDLLKSNRRLKRCPPNQNSGIPSAYDNSGVAQPSYNTGYGGYGGYGSNYGGNLGSYGSGSNSNSGWRTYSRKADDTGTDYGNYKTSQNQNQAN